MLHQLNPMGLLESINGPLQDLWLTRAGGVRPVETPQFGRWFQSLLRSSRRLKPQISHGFLAPFEGFLDASPGVLQVWENVGIQVIWVYQRASAGFMGKRGIQVITFLPFLLSKTQGLEPLYTPFILQVHHVHP